MCISLSAFLSSGSSGYVNSSTLCCLHFSNQHTFAKIPSFGYCSMSILRLRFCDSDYNLLRHKYCSFSHFIFLLVSFRIILYLLNCASVLLSFFTLFDSNASDIGFFCFYISYVFCCFRLIVSNSSGSLPFIDSSPDYLSLLMLWNLIWNVWRGNQEKRNLFILRLISPNKFPVFLCLIDLPRKHFLVTPWIVLFFSAESVFCVA